MMAAVAAGNQHSDILLERILANPNARHPFEETKQTIIRQFNDEDDVQMDALKISLIDPLMHTRIKIPSRAAECTHLQSFDLNSYLMMCEKRPIWKCPVCNKSAIDSKLIIDAYFEQVLSNVGAGVNEVELLRDGTWRLPQAKAEVSFALDEAADAAVEGDTSGVNDAGDNDDIMVVTVLAAKKCGAGICGDNQQHQEQNSSNTAAEPASQAGTCPGATEACAVSYSTA